MGGRTGLTRCWPWGLSTSMIAVLLFLAVAGMNFGHTSEAEICIFSIDHVTVGLHGKNDIMGNNVFLISYDVRYTQGQCY